MNVIGMRVTVMDGVLQRVGEIATGTATEFGEITRTFPLVADLHPRFGLGHGLGGADAAAEGARRLARFGSTNTVSYGTPERATIGPLYARLDDGLHELHLDPPYTGTGPTGPTQPHELRADATGVGGGRLLGVHGLIGETPFAGAGAGVERSLVPGWTLPPHALG